MMFDISRLKWTGLLPWLLLLSRVHVAIFGVWGVLPTAATSLSPHLLCPSFSAGSSASFHPSGCSIWPHLGFLLTSVHQTLLLHLPAIGWLVICMSEDLTDHGVVDITLRVRGLTISVSGPAAQATSFVDSITRGASNSSRASEVGSSGSFSVVDTVGPEPAAAAAPRVQETRQQIEASFDPCPGYLLNSASRLGGSLDCARSRIRRAYRAGQWAGAVLSERVGSPARSEQLSLRPRYYVVLRAETLSSPRVVTTSEAYFHIVGDLRTSSSISHAFPSETEARAYCSGARVDYPGVQ